MDVGPTETTDGVPATHVGACPCKVLKERVSSENRVTNLITNFLRVVCNSGNIFVAMRVVFDAFSDSAGSAKFKTVR
ncbi:MAG: hypothetical protein IPJ37_05795 [Bacteroidales bacterium]|nr:hypothetical protein [Bacteroidales bacterium]